MSLEVEAAVPGYYVLRVDRANADLPLIDVRIARGPAGHAQIFVLPALLHTDYLVWLRQGSARFSFDPTKVKAATIRRARAPDLLRAWARPRVAARIRVVADDALVVRPLLLGKRGGGRAIAKSMRALTLAGFGPNSANLQHTPGLLAEIGHEPAQHDPRPRSASPPRFVVALHLFYEELWPEFRHFLQRFDQPFGLVLTTPLESPAFAGDARKVFPGAEVVNLPNRGRDVAPFLQLLKDRHFDGYEFVLKLHGKRTVLSGHHAALGHVWRRASILDLAGSSERVREIVAQFDRDPGIGMIGSARFRLPGALLSEDKAWGANREATLALAARLGIDRAAFNLDYFAGTMFWARRDALRPLDKLGLSTADFPEERGQRDGELHHALERLFGSVPGVVGQRLESASAWQ